MNKILGIVVFMVVLMSTGKSTDRVSLIHQLQPLVKTRLDTKNLPMMVI